MSDPGKSIESARTALAAGHDAKSIEILHDVLRAGEDPQVLREVHELAVAGHEQASGFHKIEWHRLVIESEPQAATRPA